jgi:hypothetical protein
VVGWVHHWEVFVALVVHWSWELNVVEVALVEAWLVMVSNLNFISAMMDRVHVAVTVLRQVSQL